MRFGVAFQALKEGYSFSAMSSPKPGEIPRNCDEEVKATLKKMWNSSYGLRGHLTRHMRVAERLLKFAETHASSRLLAEMEESIAGVKAAFTKWESKILEIQDLDGQSNLDTIETTSIDVEKLLEAIFTVINDAATVAERPIIQAPTVNAGQPRCKPNSDMKPDKLSIEDPPHVMRAWVQDFSSYYSTSNMQVCSVLDQQSYLQNCLESTLRDKVTLHFQSDTPIFGDGGCIKIIETEFLQKYPLFARRLDFFREEQLDGEAWSDWAARLEKKGNEADLGPASNR